MEQGPHIDHEGISFILHGGRQELFGLKNSQNIPRFDIVAQDIS